MQTKFNNCVIIQSVCLFCCMLFRVRMDFWIRNSRLFPDFFSKAIISFSRLEVIKWVINIDLQQRRNKAFFTIHCKRTVEVEWDLTKTKKHTYKALVVVLKETSTFYHFSRLFPGLENCWDFFKIQESFSVTANVKLIPRYASLWASSPF